MSQLTHRNATDTSTYRSWPLIHQIHADWNVHGRIPHNTLDHKFSNPLQTRCTKTGLKTLVDAVNQKYKEQFSKNFEAFHKYKNYYDRKAQVQPLKVGNYTFLLNLKYNTQSDKTHLRRSSRMVHRKWWKHSHTRITLYTKLVPTIHNASIACASPSSSHTRVSRTFKWMIHSSTPIPRWSMSQKFFTTKYLS